MIQCNYVKKWKICDFFIPATNLVIRLSRKSPFFFGNFPFFICEGGGGISPIFIFSCNTYCSTIYIAPCSVVFLMLELYTTLNKIHLKLLQKFKGALYAILKKAIGFSGNKSDIHILKFQYVISDCRCWWSYSK